MNSEIVKELDGEYIDSSMNAYFKDEKYLEQYTINIPFSEHLNRWKENVKMYVTTNIKSKENKKEEIPLKDAEGYTVVTYTGTGNTTLPDDITCVKCREKLDDLFQIHTCKKGKINGN